ncbi:MAG: flagellar basal body L-ring protein FlgH [Pseudomonadota bacterium]
MRRLAVVFPLLMMGGCLHTELKNPPTPEYVPVLGASAPVIETAPTGSIYQAGRANELFRDLKAYRVGDVLTVVLSEDTSAEMRSTTTTKKDDNASLGITSLLGSQYAPLDSPIGVQSDNSRSFSGTGNSSQSNSLDGQITVTVHQVLPNGNLLIRGEKRVTINRGIEYLQLSGIVRPEDVNAQNQVSSVRIADTQITYSSRGIVGDTNTAGWASRIFNSPWWPF